MKIIVILGLKMCHVNTPIGVFCKTAELFLYDYYLYDISKSLQWSVDCPPLTIIRSYTFGSLATGIIADSHNIFYSELLR